INSTKYLRKQQRLLFYCPSNDTVNGESTIFRDGGANGISAEFDFYPDTGYTIIVLSNYDHPSARPIVKKMQEMISVSK
ncbi:MAG TPA: hypothetical protein VF679_08485, partial [Pedobacter sp.]